MLTTIIDSSDDSDLANEDNIITFYDILQDYQDLKVPLTDIPVNPCTTSELVRLCLRKQDVDDNNSDNSDESDLANEDDEVVGVYGD